MRYCTHKVFKLHVRSSQADFLYSSVLLQLTAIIRPLTTQLRNSAHLYRCGRETDIQKTHYLIAIQPVHWHSGRIYRKHVPRDHYLLLCDVTTDTKKTASPTVVCTYFGRGLEMTSYCCVLEYVYGAMAWHWALTLQYVWKHGENDVLTNNLWSIAFIGLYYTLSSAQLMQQDAHILCYDLSVFLI
jgi:hypothetical protein